MIGWSINHRKGTAQLPGLARASKLIPPNPFLFFSFFTWATLVCVWLIPQDWRYKIIWVVCLLTCPPENTADVSFEQILRWRTWLSEPQNLGRFGDKRAGWAIFGPEGVRQDHEQLQDHSDRKPFTLRKKDAKREWEAYHRAHSFCRPNS